MSLWKRGVYSEKWLLLAQPSKGNPSSFPLTLDDKGSPSLGTSEIHSLSAYPKPTQTTAEAASAVPGHSSHKPATAAGQEASSASSPATSGALWAVRRLRHGSCCFLLSEKACLSLLEALQTPSSSQKSYQAPEPAFSGGLS